MTFIFDIKIDINICEPHYVFTVSMLEGNKVSVDK